MIIEIDLIFIKVITIDEYSLLKQVIHKVLFILMSSLTRARWKNIGALIYKKLQQ